MWLKNPHSFLTMMLSQGRRQKQKANFNCFIESSSRPIKFVILFVSFKEDTVRCYPSLHPVQLQKLQFSERQREKSSIHSEIISWPQIIIQEFCQLHTEYKWIQEHCTLSRGDKGKTDKQKLLKKKKVHIATYEVIEKKAQRQKERYLSSSL